ncbi:conserved hypothetical protein (plasmid) [Rhizobium johnstonii 3841]|uniref:Uncharacterized protein n=1 Tax=Rhizobium johnstonii (strain DSM 114642 / LMG 32736 / 3841) TaxID=216596 RepID=Q1M721_RHIJ3|nr:conserved hypothetical protein [Rhizobium johnstonii 3841]
MFLRQPPADLRPGRAVGEIDVDKSNIGKRRQPQRLFAIIRKARNLHPHAFHRRLEIEGDQEFIFDDQYSLFHEIISLPAPHDIGGHDTSPWLRITRKRYPLRQSIRCETHGSNGQVDDMFRGGTPFLVFKILLTLTNS